MNARAATHGYIMCLAASKGLLHACRLSVTSPLLFKANIQSELGDKAKHSWVHLADKSNRHGDVGATS
jgi:hypothetical protein